MDNTVARNNIGLDLVCIINLDTAIRRDREF